MRPAWSPLLVAVALGGVALLADDGSTKGRPAPPAKTPRDERPARVASPPDREREALALAFVREHHPELAAVLEPLKAMKPEEYARAIADIDQVRRSLEALKTRNARRYELGLELWKARSRAELLAARWVSAPSESLEAELRAALEAQVDLEVRQQELEKQQLEARLKQLGESIDRLKDNREKRIETRMQGLRNKSQRARRLEEGKSAPRQSGRAKGESKA